MSSTEDFSGHQPPQIVQADGSPDFMLCGHRPIETIRTTRSGAQIPCGLALLGRLVADGAMALRLHQFRRNVGKPTR